jgi:L-ascorbate metabolism protein UlaG (beta-lactamase superfamily)
MLTLHVTRSFLFILPLGFAGTQDQDAPRPPKKPVELEVRALANEGFLLTVGDDVVAIDAFVAEPYVGYAALSGEPLEALLSGTGPFESLDVALASHYHRDHFQGEPAQRFLAARPDCLFASSPQVIDALWDAETEALDGVQEDKIRDFLPKPKKEDLLEVGKIRIEILRLSHGTGRFADVQNLGHVITVGGVTALHVGDAAMVPENFAAYALPKRGIDVAFVPYWYFDDPLGLRIVEEHFRPANLVACHIPPSELKAVTARLKENHPDVQVPQRALELFRFKDEN